MIRRRPTRSGPLEDGELEELGGAGGSARVGPAPPVVGDALTVLRLRAALDLIDDGVVVCDADGNPVVPNPGPRPPARPRPR